MYWMTLLLAGVASSRIFKASQSRQIEVYTWGNPKTSVNHKKWPRRGCFLGLRTETEDYRANKNNIKDVVTWLMSTYRHPEMKTVRLFDDPRRSEVKPCHWNRANDKEAKRVDPIYTLHSDDIYLKRSMQFGGKLSVMADVGLRYSYKVSPNPADIRKKGWNLIDSAVNTHFDVTRLRKEVSHLFQNPNTLECILTFEGTDRAEEWYQNINLGWKTFCGNGFFHSGFTNVTLSMCKSSAFKSKIRPKLGACKKINVAGHSLGGAMAIMWAGCVQSNKNGRTDYENLKFSWRTPAKLPSK